MSIAAVLAFATLALLMFAWLIGRATIVLQNHNEKLLRALAAGEDGSAAAGAAAMASCDGGGACH